MKNKKLNLLRVAPIIFLSAASPLSFSETYRDHIVYFTQSQIKNGFVQQIDGMQYLLSSLAKCKLPIANSASMRAAFMPIRAIGVDFKKPDDMPNNMYIQVKEQIRKRSMGCWGKTLSDNILIINGMGEVETLSPLIFGKGIQNQKTGSIKVISEPYNQDIKIIFEK